MARSITAALQQIKEQLDVHVTPADIHAACRAGGHVWRERVLSPLLTVRALLLQIVHATAMRSRRWSSRERAKPKGASSTGQVKR
jgi:hypothetical protein